MENDSDAERVLFSYGYGASLPTSAKRRLQHSVHLAKRVIQLEQANTSLRGELERERKKRSEIQQDFDNANRILDQAQQPYDFLINTVRNKDGQLKKVQETIDQLEKRLNESENERQNLIRTNQQLTKDVEKLLEYQEVSFFFVCVFDIECFFPAIESNEKCYYESSTSRTAETSTSFSIAIVHSKTSINNSTDSSISSNCRLCRTT